MFGSVGLRLAREFIWNTFCEADWDTLCFVHHYEADWSFPMCVLQCQCSEQSWRPGHRDWYRVSPKPPQRARERARTEESSRNWAWVLSARNRWIPKTQLSCHFQLITFQYLSYSAQVNHQKMWTGSRHVWKKVPGAQVVHVQLQLC